MPISRRRLLRLTIGAGIAGSVAVSAVRAACNAVSPPAGSAAATSTGGKLQLPTYVPFQKVQPDFPGTAQGVPPAFKQYPQALVTSVATPPGKGDTINATVSTYLEPPPPLDQNTQWQAVNQALHTDLQLPIINVSDYAAKFTTIIAGGDLPDLLGIGGVQVPDLLQFLRTTCADLTPYLAGDAVKAYPNLANIPAYVWKTGVYGGRIYSVPLAFDLEGAGMQVNQNVLDELGVPIDSIKSADDFMRFGKAFYKPEVRWLVGSSGGYGGADYVGFIAEFFGAPNSWRESGGKLTKDIETDEFKEAVAFIRGLWDAGLINPDAPSWGVNQQAQAFYAGKSAIWSNGLQVFPLVWGRATSVDPNFRLRVMLPPSQDGKSKPQHFLASQGLFATAIKKASDDRIKELLGVLDYLSAPFGSQEYNLLKYGVQGVDYDIDQAGNPVQTKKGVAESKAPWWDVGAPPTAIFDPNPDIAPILYQADKGLIDIGVANPTAGLFSQTNAQKGAALNQQVTDGLNAIFFGRSPVSALDQVIKDWRAGGGDQIRSEYEQELQAG
jgi:putative aldouronate transport system substrate-binding protein